MESSKAIEIVVIVLACLLFAILFVTMIEGWRTLDTREYPEEFRIDNKQETAEYLIRFYEDKGYEIVFSRSGKIYALPPEYVR